MFTKVANWMEKVTVGTLEFSLETLEIAYRILISFLNKVDEIPGNLQLVSCVCLHLASKINEHNIVAISSYMEYCMNIFSHENFVNKENEIYSTLEFKIQTETVHKFLGIIEDECLINEGECVKWRNFINTLLKDPRLYKIRLEGIIIAVLLSCENQTDIPDITDFY